MFFDLAQAAQNIAISNHHEKLSYSDLARACDAFLKKLITLSDEPLPKRRLVLLKCGNTIKSVVHYLALLRANYVIMLINPAMGSEKIAPLLAAYNPHIVVGDEHLEIRHNQALKLHDTLAILMPTSGSTGAAKMVALSYENLHANATQISQFLPIESTDKALATLPLYYSYGLSVLNSHLIAGAQTVFTGHSIMERGFWDLLEKENISCLAGVPQTYEILIRLGLLNKPLPSIKYLTQAGGKLHHTKLKQLADYATTFDKKMFVMYGQTEATARMAYLSPHLLTTKTQSIGKAIPDANIGLSDDYGHPIHTPHSVGEIIFSGPNIMLGYVNNQRELSEFSLIKQLKTGDVGYFDEDGDFYITGRKSRFTKLFGERIALDALEQWLLDKNIEALCVGNDKTLTIVTTSSENMQLLKKQVASYTQVHISAIAIITLDTLPYTSAGKKDYAALARYAEI